MNGKAELLGERISPDGMEWRYPGNHPGARPLGEAGLVVGKESRTTIARRDNRWRPYGSPSSPDAHTADIQPLTTAIDNSNGNRIIGWQGMVGPEDELPTVSSEDDAYMPSDKLPALISSSLEELTSAELYGATLEISTDPQKTPTNTFHNLGRKLFKVMRNLPWRIHIDPSSVRGQDIPGPDSVNPNPYVRTMYEQQAPEVLTFIGHGLHEHHDVNIQLAPIVAKYIRPVAYLLNAGMLSAPFGFGETAPNLYDRLGHEELRAYNGQQPHSIRYMARLLTRVSLGWVGGYAGGIGLFVVHDTLEASLSHLDKMYASGVTSAPGRGYGQYADIRLRTDPPSVHRPDHPGRIELCVKDSAAQRIERQQAYGWLSYVVVRQLERFAAGGPSAIAKLHSEFPRLFGTAPDDETFAKTMLLLGHKNSVEVGYNGNEATVEDGLGEQVSIQRQMSELIRFAVYGGQRLPPEARKEIRNSLVRTEQLVPTVRSYDASLRGYYQTGYGTAAQWMIALGEKYTSEGMSQSDVIRMTTKDGVESLEKYLTGRYAEAA